MNFDGNKSLEELESEILEESDFQSNLTRAVFRLWKTPINKYSIDDLRLMIGQNFGLKYLIPLAIEKIVDNPFAQGDFYPGDLLKSVLSVELVFWKQNPEQYYQVSEIIAGLPEILRDINNSIQRFESIEV